MKWYNEPISMADKLISCASYLTMGLVGFIWLIILAFQRAMIKEFIKFHILQSIFISIILFLFNYIMKVIISVGAQIPGVNMIVELIAWVLYSPILPLVFPFSLFSILIAAIVLYCAIASLLGKYTYLPWISDNIKQML